MTKNFDGELLDAHVDGYFPAHIAGSMQAENLLLKALEYMLDALNDDDDDELFDNAAYMKLRDIYSKMRSAQADLKKFYEAQLLEYNKRM